MLLLYCNTKQEQHSNESIQKVTEHSQIIVAENLETDLSGKKVLA